MGVSARWWWRRDGLLRFFKGERGLIERGLIAFFLPWL